MTLFCVFFFQKTVYLVEHYSACVMRDVLYGDVTFTGTYQSYERVPCLFLVLIIRKCTAISKLNISCFYYSAKIVCFLTMSTIK